VPRTPKPVAVPPSTKQVLMHYRLLAARQTVLHGVVHAAVANIDPDDLAAEISRVAPAEARKILAGAGIRDDEVFMTPSVLRERPSALGYYRLLLGLPQKQSYEAADSGLRAFASMERRGTLSAAQDARLEELCIEFNKSMADLVAQLDPTISREDLDQLPVLTLGVQFDGGLRNKIGQDAVEDLFLVIRELVEPFLVAESETSLTLTNASHRKVRVVLASDPDVRIFETIGDDEVLNVAIEMKGGSDASNAHNRAGEAEKSHQKVKNSARDFWTVIATKRVDRTKLQTESPTTRHWFNVAEVLARAGDDYEEFKRRLALAVGVQIA